MENLCFLLYQVQNLWKAIYRLTKIFAHPEFRGPLRAAFTIKGRLEKFKVDMPVICAICNRGLKERHWDIMSETVSIMYYCLMYHT